MAVQILGVASTSSWDLEQHSHHNNPNPAGMFFTGSGAGQVAAVAEHITAASACFAAHAPSSSQARSGKAYQPLFLVRG